MPRKRVVFRCDASQSIGGGHVARCLGYADAFAEVGWEATFAVSPETAAVSPALVASGYRIIEIADGQSIGDAILSQLVGAVEAFFLDSYTTDVFIERSSRAWAHQIVVIDDLIDRYRECDILINTSAGIRDIDYAGRVPHHCKLLLGPWFAPLRQGFLEMRATTLQRRLRNARADRILVCFGLTDPTDATSLALDALRELNFSRVDVAIGSSARHLKRLQEACESYASLHVDADTATLMADADLSIGAGGASAWERCCLGLPSIVITVAANQDRIAAALGASGAAVVLGPQADCDAQRVCHAIQALAGDRGRLQAMTKAASELCDGRGAGRVAALIAR